MKFISPIIILAATLILSNPCLMEGATESLSLSPAGQGQLSSPPIWFKAGKDELGNAIEYFGQAAQNGKLILTASNGFFDHGIRAMGTSKRKDVANGTRDRKAKNGITIMAFD